MKYRFLFDSRTESDRIREIKESVMELRRRGAPIEVIDTANWSDGRKWEFYLKELMPISVRKHKRLRGRVRTHRAGGIYYTSVLLAEDDFFTGEEARKKLNELRKLLV